MNKLIKLLSRVNSFLFYLNKIDKSKKTLGKKHLSTYSAKSLCNSTLFLTKLIKNNNRNRILKFNFYTIQDFRIIKL